jgi:protein-S-isoprenylcysteine O-methyltransferase Ste14
MKNRIFHPLWAHLPAVAALIFLVVYIIINAPYEASIPIHFGFDGEANAYGSPWLAFGLITGLALFFILLSVFLDELWARQEKKKAFNWLSPLDDIVVGAITGVSVYHISFLASADSLFRFPWNYLLIFCGITTAVAILLEMLRPFRPYPQIISARDDRELVKEIAVKIKNKSGFVYWDSQNPAYIYLLSILVPLIMFVSGISMWAYSPWFTAIFIVIGILMILPYGGLRTIVTAKELTIRLGMTGIRLFHIGMDRIAAAEIHEFSPLKDFGGYGIRVNSEMQAFYFKGNKGVKLTRSDGKKFLVGSDNAETLATVINAVAFKYDK